MVMALEQPFSRRHGFSRAKDITIWEGAPENLRHFVVRTAIDLGWRPSRLLEVLYRCSAYHRTRDSEGLRQWMQHVAEIRTRECEERCCAATLVGRARFRLVGRAHGPHQADVVTALRSYQASAPDANLKGAVGARPPNILLRHSGAVTAGYRPRHGGSGKGIPRAPAISAS
jgi:hypothetical protein